MRWCWNLSQWPHFIYDKQALESYSKSILQASGRFQGLFEAIRPDQQNALKIGQLKEEAISSSQIEGELLQHESVQSSLCKAFGLPHKHKEAGPKERGMGRLMYTLYEHFDEELTHESVQALRGLLEDNESCTYRTEPIRVVSGRIDDPKIHFVAPPPERIFNEMSRFIAWFNDSQINNLGPTERAGIAHLHFVIIHPFNDGNGRMARILAEKALSQALGQPCLMALSKTIEKHRKTYYEALASTNHTLDITHWLVCFSDFVVEAQNRSIHDLQLILAESKIFQQFEGTLNERQKQCLRKLFQAERTGGFVGGLSAANYRSITHTSSATATRDLAQLVKYGLLAYSGERKYTRYTLHPQILPNSILN